MAWLIYNDRGHCSGYLEGQRTPEMEIIKLKSYPPIKYHTLKCDPSGCSSKYRKIRSTNTETWTWPLPCFFVKIHYGQKRSHIKSMAFSHEAMQARGARGSPHCARHPKFWTVRHWTWSEYGQGGRSSRASRFPVSGSTVGAEAPYAEKRNGMMKSFYSIISTTIEE
jgi:hypothetical protein